MVGDERRLSWRPEMYAIYRFWRNRNDVSDCSEVFGAPGNIWTNDEGVVGALPGEVDGIVGQMLSMTVHRELEELRRRGGDGAVGVAVGYSI